MVRCRSSLVRSAETSMLVFARELVTHFTLDGNTSAQIGVLEEATVLTELTGSMQAVWAAINKASAVGGSSSVPYGLALGTRVVSGPSA